MVDNTEKREVNINAGLNEVDDVDVHAKPNSQSFIHLPNLQPVISGLLIFHITTFFLRLFSTPDKTDDPRVLHCPRTFLLGFRWSSFPCCPFIFSSYKHNSSFCSSLQHITDIHNLPPLPNGARPFGPGPQRSPRYLCFFSPPSKSLLTFTFQSEV